MKAEGGRKKFLAAMERRVNELYEVLEGQMP